MEMRGNLCERTGSRAARAFHQVARGFCHLSHVRWIAKQLYPCHANVFRAFDLNRGA